MYLPSGRFISGILPFFPMGDVYKRQVLKLQVQPVYSCRSKIPTMDWLLQWYGLSGIGFFFRLAYRAFEMCIRDRYKDVDGIVMANFKTYGGTEKTDNVILSIEETAQIVCRYRPDIKSDTRVVLLQTGTIYEILGEPENIEMRNMFLKFKIRRIKGCLLYTSRCV